MRNAIVSIRSSAFLFAFAFLAGCVPLASAGDTTAHIFNVRDFGAKGDGVTLDTRAIQSAIDACGRAGGTVILPGGTYVTGSLELRSNIELHVPAGTTILGSTNLADYFERTPVLKSYNNLFLKYSLFYAERQSNITITGRGTIDGQGAAFKVLTDKKPEKYMNRPYLLRFVECSNIAVEHVTLRNSASWTQHYLACNGVVLRGLTVYGHANKNNDMMDIDGCSNVIVTDCTGDTDDDGITLKSTSDRITENVTIGNCIVSSHCNAIKTGTESTGGFRNIVISNIVVKPSSVTTTMSGTPKGISGIALTLVDGGTLEGVSISHVVMDGPDVPIFIRLGNRGRKSWAGAPQPGVGTLREVMIDDVTARSSGTTGCSITGLDGHPVEHVTLTNIRLDVAGGVTEKPPVAIPEKDDQYPEATMWGTLPSSGFYLRHVDGIRMANLTVTPRRADARPVFILHDVTNITMDGLEAYVLKGTDAAMLFDDVRNLILTGSTIHGNADALFRLSGNANAQLSITGNDLAGIPRICVPEQGQATVIEESNNRLHR
jgi:hypothetical protein